MASPITLLVRPSTFSIALLALCSALQGFSAHPLDPIRAQNLAAVMERAGQKPWDLFRRGDELLTHRIIFRDVEHGAEVWMLDPSPASDHAHTAGVWSPWNADGTLLYLNVNRPDEAGGMHTGFLTDGRFSRLRPTVAVRWPVWHPKNPDLLYIHPEAQEGGSIDELNVRTGERRTLQTWKGFPRERLYGFTRDQRYLFVDTPNGGLWVGYEPGQDSIPPLRLYDGRPGRAPWPDGRPSRRAPAHPDTALGRNLVIQSPELGPIIRIRVGMLIDRETGTSEAVIVPASGESTYLRTYAGQNGRIHFPEGPEWSDVRLHTSDDLNELFEIYRYYPFLTHGHEAISPDGEWIIRDGRPLEVYRTRTGENVHTLRISSDAQHYHVNWGSDPRFFIGWIRGWPFGTFHRTDNANLVYQTFTDGTWQPIHNTQHRFNGYYGGGNFSILSPDSTKIHTASNMTGRFRNYITVLSRPQPPQSIDWRAESDSVRISWTPSRLSRETHGYFIYRSEISGDHYRLLTPDPVSGTAWSDRTAQPGTAYHYVVTAVDHSGLESAYSMEAARAGVRLPPGIEAPLRVYLEAEDADAARMSGLSIGRDRWQASNWSYLYRTPSAQSGRASLNFTAPATGRYHVWLRVRTAPGGGPGVWEIAVNGAGQASATADSETWHWVRTTGQPARVSAGANTLTLGTRDDRAHIDMICLATDPNFVPEGPRPQDASAPAPVQGLKAWNVRERVNRLSWDVSTEADLAHYNVYVARESFGETSQRRLIASPNEPLFIDWGLRAGETYHYAVTAVDRRGNESPLSALAIARTPAATRPGFEKELRFSEADRQGTFEEASASGTRSAAFLVPEDRQDNRVSWQVDIPADGEYFLWLRYLHRSSGSRSAGLRQDIIARLNGREITRLGGGSTDLGVPDSELVPGNPLAEEFWTWAFPGLGQLESLTLPAGRHTLSLEELTPDIRYDVLLITNEPAWQPPDGRLRQAP